MCNFTKKHKWVLENFSPVELMEQYQGGGKIPDADLAIIEGLLYDYKLPYNIVNVLIEYVMLTNDYKLPRSLIEKIAGHWKRLKIGSVDEALEVAKKEHQLYKEWKDTNQKKNTQSDKKAKQSTTKGKKEKVPDYILKQEEKYHQNNNNNQEQVINQEKKAKIDKLLKDLGEV